MVGDSADVTVAGSNFSHNLRRAGPGAALIAAGNATLRVVSSHFHNSSAAGKANYAGMCVAVCCSCALS